MMSEMIDAEPLASLDYVAVVDAASLSAVDTADRRASPARRGTVRQGPPHRQRRRHGGLTAMTGDGPGLDLLVLGSGVAGLSAAVRAADALGLRVGVLTKGELDQAATRWAQGGVAAVLAGDPDSTDLHLADTLAAGAGLCDVEAVRILVDEGPGRVTELIAMGAAFDRSSDGRLELAREGGHTLPRVVHAGGAATGAEIERALVEAVRRSAVAVFERWFALDFIVEGGRCRGVTALAADGVVREIRATNVLTATGGSGQVFAVTTNPLESTGDGLAMALRSGVAVADIEFVQFHPTALHHPAVPRPLLSEALRGHGALAARRQGRALRRRAAATRRGVARDDRRGCSSRTSIISGSTPRASNTSTSASRPSPRRCGRSASIRRPTGCRSRPRPTTSAAASSPTSTARRRCRGCGRRARSHARASTGRTGSRRTRCSKGWSSDLA